jgi:hypothetical protein
MAIFHQLFVAILLIVSANCFSRNCTHTKPEQINVNNITFVLTGKYLGEVRNPQVSVLSSLKESEKTLLGVTEHFVNISGDPEWNKVFWVVWNQGTRQKIHVRAIDYPHGVRDPRVREIGYGALDVDSYVENGEVGNVTLTAPEIGGGGKLIIFKKTTPIKFQLSARNLRPADEFGTKSDPYVKVYYRKGRNGPNNKFYTTSVINNVGDADWEDVIDFDNLQFGSDQFLFFKVRDKDSITRDDHLGEAVFNVDDFLTTQRCTPIPIPLEKSDRKDATLMITVV